MVQGQPGHGQTGGGVSRAYRPEDGRLDFTGVRLSDYRPPYHHPAPEPIDWQAENRRERAARAAWRGLVLQWIVAGVLVLAIVAMLWFWS